MTIEQDYPTLFSFLSTNHYSVYLKEETLGPIMLELKKGVSIKDKTILEKLMQEAGSQLSVVNEKWSGEYYVSMDELLRRFKKQSNFSENTLGNEFWLNCLLNFVLPERKLLSHNDKFMTLDEKEKRNYPYIPYMPTVFIEKIQQFFGKNLKGKFVDVGCGLGDKLLLAKMLNPELEVFGIEYNETYCNIASERIASKIRGTIIHGDAFAQEYGEYDYIYLYHPIYNPDSMYNLYHHIYKTMKPGAMMLDVYPADYSWPRFAEDVGQKPERYQYMHPVTKKV